MPPDEASTDNPLVTLRFVIRSFSMARYGMRAGVGIGERVSANPTDLKMQVATLPS
jgi:hypothetical protein